MSFKRTLIAFTMLFCCTTIFAANHELASHVINIKTAITDRQIIQNDNTEAFMELLNTGKQPHTLVAAFSRFAKQVQLHRTVHKDGHTSMQQVHKIVIKAHGEKDLQFDGLHIMLIGLKRYLITNKIVPITLIFNDGSWLIVNTTFG